MLAIKAGAGNLRVSACGRCHRVYVLTLLSQKSSGRDGVTVVLLDGEFFSPLFLKAPSLGVPSDLGRDATDPPVAVVTRRGWGETPPSGGVGGGGGDESPDQEETAGC